jgi:hypothetical protein
MDNSGSGRFVLSDKENLGLGDQTLVSVGSTSGKHDVKVYGDFGGACRLLLLLDRLHNARRIRLKIQSSILTRFPTQLYNITILQLPDLSRYTTTP